nr:transmembrane 9 superfamily member 9 [Ipomoea batatas]
MREQETCKVACRIVLDAKAAKEFKEKIDDEYRVNMILDNLPLVMPIKRPDLDSIVYQHGFHVGLKGQYAGSKEEKFFIHNHLAFTVKFHKDEQTDAARIVGFEVKPFSVKHEYDGKWKENTQLKTCDVNAKRTVTSSDSPQEVEDKKEIIFTYDVKFEESDIKWASRWDSYLLMADDQIHWFSIVNSLMIVLFLSGMVAMIMLRSSNKLGFAMCIYWNWSSVLVHDTSDYDICCSWILITFKPWRIDDCYASSVGLYGCVCWVRIGSSLQDV